MNKQPQEWNPKEAYDRLQKDIPEIAEVKSLVLAILEIVSREHNAALAAKDHTWNLVRLKDIKEVTDKAAKELAAERKENVRLRLEIQRLAAMNAERESQLENKNQ